MGRRKLSPPQTVMSQLRPDKELELTRQSKGRETVQTNRGRGPCREGKAGWGETAVTEGQGDQWVF